MQDFTLKVGVVGAGAVGPVLGAAFLQAGHHLVGITARSEASRERVEAMLPQTPVLDIEELLSQSDLVLFCVRDGELRALVEDCALAGWFRAGQLVGHTAGSLGLAVLEPATALGAIPLALHPAQTFSGTSLDLARLRGVHWAVSAPVPLLAVAQALVLDLEGVPHVLSDVARGHYHAALAHGANHLVTVVTQAMRALSAAGVNQAAEFLEPLLKTALERALQEGEKGLSGPILRADTHTIRRHLAALDRGALVAEPDTEPGKPLDDLADIPETYRACARATAKRAYARQALSDEQYLELLDSLDSR